MRVFVLGMHTFVAFVNETLCDHLVAAVVPPPRRADRRSDYGLAVATAIDVYMDTEVRELGLWVEDIGHKYFGIRPRLLPAGVAEHERSYIDRYGLMIGAPEWVSRSTGAVLTTDRARIEATRLLALARTLTPWEGHLDADGVLSVDYMAPRPPRSPRRRTKTSCASCGRST
ncbi:MAG: hypothetical protein JO257_03545 [Deltaproteobacteria bacterium]|nr:hypothetical protein [Deltaproteobacteria bacterium]